MCRLPHLSSQNQHINTMQVQDFHFQDAGCFACWKVQQGENASLRTLAFWASCNSCILWIFAFWFISSNILTFLCTDFGVFSCSLPSSSNFSSSSSAAGTACWVFLRIGRPKAGFAETGGAALTDAVEVSLLALMLLVLESEFLGMSYWSSLFCNFP